MNEKHMVITKQLEALYGHVLFTHEGQSYPVIVHPADSHSKPDDLLGTFTEQYATRDDFAFYDDAHLQSRQATRQITNGLCYRATRLHLNPLRLDAGLGHYFDMIATCDALDHELRRCDGKTPHRDALHRDISEQDSLFDTRKRSATIGAAVLTVFYDGSQYQASLGHRAENLADGAGLFHVLPAFVVQPMIDLQAEWSLQHQILREYGEELFGMAEYDTLMPLPTTPDYFLNHPHVQELTTMLEDGRADLYATGIILNLLSMRFELTSVLMIHDANWYTRNESALKAAFMVERQATYITPIQTLDALPDDWAVRFAPQGLACLLLGRERVIQHNQSVSG
jgi:hypothetical protein